MAVLALVELAVAITGAVLVARPGLVWPTFAAQGEMTSLGEKRTQTRAIGLVFLGVGLVALSEGVPTDLIGHPDYLAYVPSFNL